MNKGRTNLAGLLRTGTAVVDSPAVVAVVAVVVAPASEGWRVLRAVRSGEREKKKHPTRDKKLENGNARKRGAKEAAGAKPRRNRFL